MFVFLAHKGSSWGDRGKVGGALLKAQNFSSRILKAQNFSSGILKACAVVWLRTKLRFQGEWNTAASFQWKLVISFPPSKYIKIKN